MAKIIFTQDAELEIVDHYDEDNDVITNVMEIFRAGNTIDVDILDDYPESNTIDVQFGDGSCCFGLCKDCVRIEE